MDSTLHYNGCIMCWPGELLCSVVRPPCILVAFALNVLTFFQCAHSWTNESHAYPMLTIYSNALSHLVVTYFKTCNRIAVSASRCPVVCERNRTGHFRPNGQDTSPTSDPRNSCRSVGTLITFAEGGYVFGSVCLSVCPSDNWKSCERILTKFLGGVAHGPGTNEFNFGDDPDHRPDPGVRSGSRSGSWEELAFGGGLHHHHHHHQVFLTWPK